MPIEVLAEERGSLYRQKGSTSLSPTELKAEARRKSMERWQSQWGTSLKGRWTYRLIRPSPPDPSGTEEDAVLVFFVCSRFRKSRSEWKSALGETILPESLVEAMLSSKAAWNATSDFAAKVMKQLREVERRRKNAV
ncbi:uncharacterized protein LOC107037937 [Diachasma alloeum]|uniref:uncharacterized protein LOC107037937 n=1 Tax=Diachasma alloeum TaxID=454923 RepID=UPI000738509F|nr:uncharacterized protein LOC107037937 [Diachasma alloeum]